MIMLCKTGIMENSLKKDHFLFSRSLKIKKNTHTHIYTLKIVVAFYYIHKYPFSLLPATWEDYTSVQLNISCGGGASFDQ